MNKEAELVTTMSDGDKAADVVGNARFQPGKSGNPRGRPRKAASYYNLLEAAYAEEVTVTINGKKQTVTYVEAMIMTLKSQAAKGSVEAMALLLKGCPQHILDSLAPDEAEATKAADDIWRRVMGKLTVPALMDIRRVAQEHAKTNPVPELRPVKRRR